MLKKFKNRSQSAKKVMSSDSLNTNLPELTVTTSYKLFHSIHDLPFSIFQLIIIDGDLKLLIIEGEPTDHDLSLAWEDILQQYSTAIGEKDDDGYFSSRRELIYFQSQRFLLYYLVARLQEYYVPRWARMLNKIVRSNFKFDPANIEEYCDLLERCVARSKGIIDLQIEMLENKIKGIEKKRDAQGSAKPTKDFFAKVLINLHEFSNWNFDEEKISTFQYCELLRRYTQHIEYLQRQKRA